MSYYTYIHRFTDTGKVFSKLVPTQHLRGKIGGSSTSLAKQEAARANGKLGGRPKGIKLIA